MELRRTVQVKLDVDGSDEERLRETFRAFREACQYTVDYAWNNRTDGGHIDTRKTWLHEQTYDDIKEQTGLNTGLIQKARDYAVDSLQQVINRWKEGEQATKPTFQSWFVAYDYRTVTYTDEGCTLATVDGRVQADFVIDETGDNPQTEYLSEEWGRKEATLHHRGGDYYLHISVVKEEDVGETESGTSRSGSFDGSQIEDLRTVLGVDLNSTGSFAVTSTGRFVGSSDHINHERDEYESRRASLQRNGSRRAHEVIERMGDRFSQWSNQKYHKWANEIVEEAVRYDCSTIVFEELDGIRERISNNKEFQQWAFNQFVAFVEYKAEEYGVSVESVNPEYTSQTCSRCGHTDRSNRRTKHDFECRECGYSVDADYNASKNVGLRYVTKQSFADVCESNDSQHVRRVQKSQDGRATCQLALKSGTLKPSEGSSSTERLEVEYMDKPHSQRAFGNL
ncbi:RNA-guided endonuclease InsQ/TnpB family protein [Halorutilales archaeon Cl-col2-1]